MYFVYILHSNKFDRYYIGQTQDLDKRLARHNSGWVMSTKAYIPWKLICWEPYKTRSESVNREKYLKSLKSRMAIMDVIELFENSRKEH